ncbi:MAG: hypothetical protein ACRERR_01780 [Moraxellaceae bacterium]
MSRAFSRIQPHFLTALLIALCFFLPARASEKNAETEWRIVIARDVYTDYQRFIGQRDPLTLQHFSGPYSRRDVVELVLLQQALQRGGASRPLRFVLTDSESRTLKTLAHGEADIGGASSWKSSISPYSEHLQISRAVIAQGRFMAGLYFPEGHPALQSLPTRPQDISRYTAICADSWEPDLVALKSLGSTVLKTENWESMLGMLKKQRGDFLLAPFQPTIDMRLKAGDMVLLPVRGLKVSLAGSRHFVFWQQGKQSEILRKALDHGIESLERDGTLQRAYRESGFDNSALQSWRVLNP